MLVMMRVKIRWHLLVTETVEAKSVQSAIEKSKRSIVKPLRERLGKSAVEIPGIESRREDYPPEVII